MGQMLKNSWQSIRTVEDATSPTDKQTLREFTSVTDARVVLFVCKPVILGPPQAITRAATSSYELRVALAATSDAMMSAGTGSVSYM